jgi:hypothetical protein
MNVALVVEVARREHQLLEHAAGLALGEGPLGVDAVEQVAALGELEEKEHMLGVLYDAVALAYVLVDQLRHDGGLRAGALRSALALGRLDLVDHLHRELLLGLHAHAIVDRSGRALADLPNHLYVVAHA